MLFGYDVILSGIVHLLKGFSVPLIIYTNQTNMKAGAYRHGEFTGGYSKEHQARKKGK